MDYKDVLPSKHWRSSSINMPRTLKAANRGGVAIGIWKILLIEVCCLYLRYFLRSYIRPCGLDVKLRQKLRTYSNCVSRSPRWVPVIVSKTKDIFYGSSYFCGISQSVIVKEVIFLTWGIFLHWSQSHPPLLVGQRQWTIVNPLDRTVLFKLVLLALVNLLVVRAVALANPFQPIWRRIPRIKGYYKMVNREMVLVLILIDFKEILTYNRYVFLQSTTLELDSL